MSEMTDPVIVVMERESATELARGRASRDADTDQFRAWDEGRDQLRAALDRDREQLVERVGRVIDPHVWDEDNPNAYLLNEQSQARNLARAVLEVLAGEGPTDA